MYLKKEEIDDILIRAKSMNTKNKISGILIHSDGNFFQIIEGDKKTVQELYLKIEDDHRHHSLIKIFQKDLNYPSFNSLKKEFVAISGKKFKDYALQKYLNLEATYNKNNYASTSYLINKFIYGETRHAAYFGSKEKEVQTQYQASSSQN